MNLIIYKYCVSIIKESKKRSKDIKPDIFNQIVWLHAKDVFGLEKAEQEIIFNRINHDFL